MGKYDYLKKYICKDRQSNGILSNSFYNVSDERISLAEKRLGFEFPSQLKEFWQEIGYGFFNLAETGEIQNDNDNRIITPGEIADILLSDPDSPDCPVIYEFYELLRPGDMPFFEIGDSVDFLYMCPKSENPNAVWDGRRKICDSFEEFVYRLYHESPTFYSDNWGPKLDN